MVTIQPRDINRVFAGTYRTPTTATHPLVRHLADCMEGNGIGRYAIAKAADLHRNVVREWMINGVAPNIDTFEQALGPVGLRLSVKRVGTCAVAAKSRKCRASGKGAPGTHWLVSFARLECQRLNISLESVTDAAGLKHKTCRAWWGTFSNGKPNNPRLDTIEAFMAVLGYALEIVPAEPAEG